MGRLKKVVYATITVVVSLVVADLLLHAAVYVSPQVSSLLSVVAAQVPDARLVHRPNPAYPGHDENGFRNPRVPQSADVVTLGDSQTYGSGVIAEKNWPSVFEQLSGRSVYNLAFGGYGPAHSLALWEQASRFSPAIVIEGMYAGNDLYDSYQIVYMYDSMPELRSDDPEILNLIAKAEDADPLNQRIAATSRSRKKNSWSKRLNKSIKAWVADNSKIYALYWRTRYELKRFRNRKDEDEEDWEKSKAKAEKNPQRLQLYVGETSRTIFTANYRLTALDLEDPRIREGKRVAFEAIRRLNQLAGARDIRFIVLLIPTKELVFSEQAKDFSAPGYRQLVSNERQLWNETRSFLETHSIEYVDALPKLRQKLDAGEQPYRITRDGHPNEIGYRAIAETVHSYLAAN